METHLMNLDLRSQSLSDLKYFEILRRCLGILTQDLWPVNWTYIGVTINLSPDYITSPHVRYGHLGPKEQIEYLQRYLKDVYAQHVADIFYVFEFTKNGEIHCHALMIERDAYNQFNLMTLRKSVSANPKVLKMTRFKRADIIRSNYIHEVDPLVWMKYMCKDIDKTPYGLLHISNLLNVKARVYPSVDRDEESREKEARSAS